MKPPKQAIQRWIDDLRSGKFKQTVGRLQDDYGFCCLGVLCATQIPEDKQKRDERGFLDSAIARVAEKGAQRGEG